MKKSFITIISFIIILSGCGKKEPQQETKIKETKIEDSNKEIKQKEETTNTDKEEKHEKDDMIVESAKDYYDKEDLYYSIYNSFVKFDDNGDVVKISKNLNTTLSPIKYSDSLFFEYNADTNKSRILKNDKGESISTIYEFEDGLDFEPFGAVYNKVFGVVRPYEIKDGTMSLLENEQYIGVVDLKAQKLINVDSTRGQKLLSYAVTNKVLQYTINEGVTDNLSEEDKNIVKSEDEEDSFDDGIDNPLFSIPLKNIKQEPERIQDNTDGDLIVNRYINNEGVTKYDIYETTFEKSIFSYDEEINDNELLFHRKRSDKVDFINNSIIIYKYTSNNEDDIKFDLIINDLITSDNILNETVKGVRIKNNILYYIDKDNNIQQVELKYDQDQIKDYIEE